MSRRSLSILLLLALLLIAIGLTTALVIPRQPPLPQPPAQLPHPLSPPGPSLGTVNMLLGNPSSATPNPSDKDNFLEVNRYYALSYNSTKGTPNWVSWRVTKDDLGSAPRKHDFAPDLDLPALFYRVTTHDYTNSGFDRGHMCPHSDRAATLEMSYATFVMSNIIPQASNVNEKAWAHLEEYCRDLVLRDHDRLFIVSGPDGIGGTGKLGYRDSLASDHVTVPATCWKVVVVVSDDGNNDDLSKITPRTRVISVIMPNDNTKVSNGWLPFRASPAEIERRTHLHFFDNISPQIADALRAKIDSAPIPDGIPVRMPN